MNINKINKMHGKALLKLEGVGTFLNEGGNLPFYELPQETKTKLYIEFGPAMPHDVLYGTTADETLYMFVILDDLKTSNPLPVFVADEPEVDEVKPVIVHATAPIEAPETIELPSSPAIEQPVESSEKKRGRGRPCKCAERGIECKHGRSFEMAA